jgi:GntR family transcriptional repressor for pyruvate dehydrogenase complex
MSASAPPRNEEIAELLRDEILRGQYRAGERLPSERDLALRFEVSRGGIREALKRLEQLGISHAQPGGARVVPLEEATLDVLGPLLDLDKIPDPPLVDETLEVLGALMALAARQAVERADELQMQTAVAIVSRMANESMSPLELIATIRELLLHFVFVSDNLVIRLIVNGLKTQFLSRLHALKLHPTPDPRAITTIQSRLLDGLYKNDGDAIAKATQDLLGLMRQSVMRSLTDLAQPDIQRKANR